MFGQDIARKKLFPGSGRVGLGLGGWGWGLVFVKFKDRFKPINNPCLNLNVSKSNH